MEEKLAHVREFCRKNRMNYNLSTRVRDFYSMFYERHTVLSEQKCSLQPPSKELQSLLRTKVVHS